ncbi:MAG: hypothetical protein LBV39_00500, partial [Bacteroidales bacterium]|nr:hypothetical protein [Bacteroidales bacterium]
MGKVFRETKAIVRSFVSFLYQPSDFKEERKSVFSYILAFGFIYLCAIGIRFVTLAIVNKLGTPIPRTIPPIDQSTLRFVLLGSFISPVIEEFLFRYPLKYTKNCLFICVLAFGLSAVFFNQVAMSSFTFNTQRLLIILPIAVCVFLLTRIEKVNNVLQK